MHKTEFKEQKGLILNILGFLMLFISALLFFVGTDNVAAGVIAPSLAIVGGVLLAKGIQNIKKGK